MVYNTRRAESTVKFQQPGILLHDFWSPKKKKCCYSIILQQLSKYYFLAFSQWCYLLTRTCPCTVRLAESRQRKQGSSYLTATFICDSGQALLIYLTILSHDTLGTSYFFIKYLIDQYPDTDVLNSTYIHEQILNYCC